MKLLTILFLSLQYVFSFRIVSKNYVVFIDGESNEGKIVETVEYDFENLTVSTLVEKYFPIIEGVVTNYTVTSPNHNVINSWKVDKKGKENYFLVNVSSLLDKPIKIIYTYLTKGLMNPSNQSVNFIVSNSDSATDISSKVDVILEKIHDLVMPKNIIIDKNYDFGYFYDNEKDLSYQVQVNKDTLVTIKNEHIATRKENNLKKNETIDIRKKNYKISFTEILKKNSTNQIKFRIMTDKPKGSSSGVMTRPPPPVSSSKPMTRPPPPVSSSSSSPSSSDKDYSYNKEKKYSKKEYVKDSRSGSGSNNSAWEAIIGLLYIACLIFLCYECCTRCCGSSEAAKGAEGEYVYVCN